MVVDRDGTVEVDFRFEDTPDGWHRLNKRWSWHSDLAVTIETSSGTVVERLLEAGYDIS